MAEAVNAASAHIGGIPRQIQTVIRSTLRNPLELIELFDKIGNLTGRGNLFTLRGDALRLAKGRSHDFQNDDMVEE